MKVDLPVDYRPSGDEPYMNPEQLEYFRRKLVDWRVQLTKGSKEMMVHLKEKKEEKPEAVDQGLGESETALKLETGNLCRELIHRIDDALNRIADGTYGFCSETGEEIGIRRLEAWPIATLSIGAQRRHEAVKNPRQFKYSR